MKKILLFTALLFIGLIIFLPKSELYYSAEEALAPTHLYLSGEEVHDRLFYLDIDNATMLLDTVEIGSITHIRFLPLIALNRITMSEIEFSGDFATLFPAGIEYLNFTHSLLHPMSIAITGEGEFGPFDGEIDLIKNRLTLHFTPSPLLRQYPLLLSKLRKSDEGLIYETSF